MLVLFETPAGYAVFKLLDEKKLHESENLYKDFETAEKASKIVKLKVFKKFADTTEALAAATASVEGKMGKTLKKVLKKLVASDAHEKLAVADAKLGGVIKEKMELNCVSNSQVQELMRCIRCQLDSLIGELPQKEIAAMALGLAHSLSRYKLKFSPDKVDTMIVQAVSLLDDLDKELNNYIMRCKEWYGWHFPELAKILTDNMMYIKAVQMMGMRVNASDLDFSSILPEELEDQVKEAAEISMGTEISDDDILNINNLCEQVIEISDYRTQLYEYLKNRMMAIAPNLTTLVGELIGAKLISHSGSLLNLAKHPASTVQILGAEKALFRSLKARMDTPKYGLLYHAQLVGQCGNKTKGAITRSLACKAALASRVDALGEDTCDLGVEHKAKIQHRIHELEHGYTHRISGMGKYQADFPKHQAKGSGPKYSDAADSTIPTKRKMEEEAESKPSKKLKLIDNVEEENPTTPTSEKKKKKKKRKSEAEEEEPEMKVEAEEPEGAPSPKKKKKKKKQQDDE